MEEHGQKGLRSLYKDAMTDLQHRLQVTTRKGWKVDPLVINGMMTQVDETIGILGRNLNRHLTDTGRLAAQMGGRHGLEEFKKLQRRYTGTVPVLDLDSAAVFRGMVADIDVSLLRRHKTQVSAWSYAAIAKFERRLSVGALTGKPFEELISDLMQDEGLADEERWRAERIVRTEMAYAHGATKHRAISDIAKEQPALRKKILETIDDRTGDDSFLVHGQTRLVSEPFVWWKRKKGTWITEQYMHPPNRPNDRAVVIPWDPSWPESELERPLTRGELRSAAPTVWRKKPGVAIPPQRQGQMR